MFFACFNRTGMKKWNQVFGGKLEKPLCISFHHSSTNTGCGSGQGLELVVQPSIKGPCDLCVGATSPDHPQ